MGSGLWHPASVHEDRLGEVSAISPCTGTRANFTPTTSVQQQLWLREDHDPVWFSHSAFPITLAPGVTVFAPYQRDGWSRKTQIRDLILASCSFSCFSHDAVTFQTPQLARFAENESSAKGMAHSEETGRVVKNGYHKRRKDS